MQLCFIVTVFTFGTSTNRLQIQQTNIQILRLLKDVCRFSGNLLMLGKLTTALTATPILFCHLSRASVFPCHPICLRRVRVLNLAEHPCPKLSSVHWR